MIYLFIKYIWSTIFNFAFEYVYYTLIFIKIYYNTQEPSHFL